VRELDRETAQLVQDKPINIRSINTLNELAEKVTAQTLDLEKYVNNIKKNFNESERIFYQTFEKP